MPNFAKMAIELDDLPQVEELVKVQSKKRTYEVDDPVVLSNAPRRLRNIMQPQTLSDQGSSHLRQCHETAKEASNKRTYEEEKSWAPRKPLKRCRNRMRGQTLHEQGCSRCTASSCVM